MDILHTADLHLDADRPRTLEAFGAVLERAAAHGVDLVTVGGDVFDSPADATRLKDEVRQLCTGNPFEIVAIPGNHDAQILSRPFDLGPDLRILQDDPCESYDRGEVRIVGVPFRETLTSELFEALQVRTEGVDHSILLLHCTLDVGFDAGETGADEPRRYFPVDPATLGELEYDAVLAGHFHGYADQRLDGETRFIYPGSPTSHTRGETGRRAAALLDTETGSVEPIDLETFYYDSLSITVTPDEQRAVPDRIESWVGERAGDDCELAVTVGGFVDANERAYADRLREAAAPVEPELRIDSISHVLEHELFERFRDRLDESVLEDHPRATVEGTRAMARDALAGLLDTGEIRE